MNIEQPNQAVIVLSREIPQDFTISPVLGIEYVHFVFYHFYLCLHWRLSHNIYSNFDNVHILFSERNLRLKCAQEGHY